MEKFSPYPKGVNKHFYLRTGEKHELNGKLTHKALVEGLIIRSPEQKEVTAGRDYVWE